MDTQIVDLAKKELLSTRVNLSRMGANAMRACLTRKGALPWVIVEAGELQCSICVARS